MNERDVDNLQADAPAVGPKYPGIEVQLSGEDGNAYAIIGRVRKALQLGGATMDEVMEFHAEATSGDYDHLLQTCMRWVEVD